MPFKPKLLTDVPSGTPDVQIFFHGQLLLRSEDGATCEVVANPIATGHVLTIEARIKPAGRADLIGMRHIGPLHFRQGEGMLIEVINPVAPSPAAWKCITLDPIDYETGNAPPPRDQDFRWILNLEGTQFHERELNSPLFNSQHVIRLRGGEYFFRTAARASAQFVYKRSGGGKGDKTFRRIGAIASASVFLDTNQSVVLRWQDGTQEEDRVLTLTKTPDTTYEIYIENTPLFQVTPPPAELENRDELIEFYKVIQAIPPVPPLTRFKFAPDIPEDGLGPESDSAHPIESEKGSPSIPCQVMRLDGPPE